jgi:Flp pilus assembly pilin Flp
MSSHPLQRRLARLRSEDGQTMIEYGGVALLISITVILIMAAIGLDIAEGFDYIEDALGLGNDNTIDTAPGTDDQAAPTGVL